MAQIWQYPSSVPPSSGVSNHFTARSVYVDNVYGNNTTAQIDNQHLPYRTLQAAIDALGNAGVSVANVHVLSIVGTGNVYNYTGTYGFSRINIIVYNATSISMTNIPSILLSITVIGNMLGLNLNINSVNNSILYINSLNNIFNCNVSYNASSTNIAKKLTFKGNYQNLNVDLSANINIDNINVLFSNCNVGVFNFLRTGEKTMQDYIIISNCKFDGVTINCNNIVNNTPHVEYNFVFKILNSSFNELTGATIIQLDGFADGLCELHIENSQIYSLSRLRVLGFVRCRHSRIDKNGDYGDFYIHIPSTHILQPYETSYGDVFSSEFSHCIFGSNSHLAPTITLDIPLYRFEYCTFYYNRDLDPGDPDDRFKYCIWDMCSSTDYNRDIYIKYCKVFIRNTTSSTPIFAFLFVRGTENNYNRLQRYYIEHCNITGSNFLDYLVIVDERNSFGPYPYLASLIYNPITSLGSNGSYDITIKYTEASGINQNIIMYALSTPNRTYIRDYYNRYDVGGPVHNETATTDVFVYHTEANNEYNSGSLLYGDSKQVVRRWNSGSLGLSPQYKTNVLLPGFTGPVFLASASSFADYKELIIINNTGIPITITPSAGDTIDGFTSVILGVNQRITLKRISTTEFALI